MDLKFNDLPGLWQHFSLPISEFEENIFKEGIGFDGSSIRGFQEIHESDMILIPDAKTAVVDPVCKYPDCLYHLRHLRPHLQAGLYPRPTLRGQEGRGVPEVDRDRGHQLLGTRDGVFHL